MRRSLDFGGGKAPEDREEPRLRIRGKRRDTKFQDRRESAGVQTGALSSFGDRMTALPLPSRMPIRRGPGKAHTTAPRYKRCPKCGETKTASSFHRNKSRADGLNGHCKACVKAYEVVRRHERWVAAKSSPAKALAYMLPGYCSFLRKRNRGEVPSKQSARRLAGMAVRCRLVVRDGKCRLCGRTADELGMSGLQLHHVDYLRPLAVIEVCPSCHMGTIHPRSANGELLRAVGDLATVNDERAQMRFQSMAKALAAYVLQRDSELCLVNVDAKM